MICQINGTLTFSFIILIVFSSVNYNLYGLYGPRCPLPPKRPINLTSLYISICISICICICVCICICISIYLYMYINIYVYINVNEPKYRICLHNVKRFYKDNETMLTNQLCYFVAQYYGIMYHLYAGLRAWPNGYSTNEGAGKVDSTWSSYVSIHDIHWGNLQDTLPFIPYK